MEPVEGTRSFAAGAAAYDAFMGRWSRPLAPLFADAAGVARGMRVLDVGCGPGALTGVLVERLGVDHVAAVDPSPAFLAECAARHPGVEARQGSAEVVPFPEAAFDGVLSQLVLHFVSDPGRCAAELRRVVRPDGTVAACVWDFAEGMEMLRLFWDAALALDPDAPDEARVLRFGREGEIAALFTGAGLTDVTETTLEVTSVYAGFDELWDAFLAGVGPAGSYCVALPDGHRDALRAELRRRLGSPAGGFGLRALARAAVARAPG